MSYPNITHTDRGAGRSLGRKALSGAGAMLLLPALIANHALADAVITQEAGTANHADITQVDAMAASALVVQSGESNEGSVYQEGPIGGVVAADITQQGSDNYAILEQSAILTNASANISQSGDSNIAVGTQSQGDNLSLSIDQSVGNHLSEIVQDQYHATAESVQQGYQNRSYIGQSGGEGRDEAYVYQDGAYNVTTVYQTDGNAGYVMSTQIGDSNSTHVEQSTPFMMPSTAILTTEGEGNVTNLKQDNALPGYFNLSQTGTGNIINVTQGGEAAHAEIVSVSSNFNNDDIEQVSLGSELVITRANTDNSTTTVRAFGIDNISINQVDSQGASVSIEDRNSFDSSFSVSQVGVTDSSAVVNFDGAHGTANIEQTNVSNSTATANMTHESYEYGLITSIYQSDGADLTATVEQSGYDNEAVILQANSVGDDAYIIQSASGNFAEITQIGGDSNTAVINQTGTDYSATINQAGSDQSATIVQM